MQEIKKRRIVLASVLKPVDDTRMYGKLAASVASTFETHVIGYPSRSETQHTSPFPADNARITETISSPNETIPRVSSPLGTPGTSGDPVNATTSIDARRHALPVNKAFIRQHALPHIRRLGIGRLLTPFRILRKVLRLRPAVLIVCTPELLPIAMLARIGCRCRVIYDVQENYWQNIWYGQTWKAMAKPFVAFFIRLVEHSTAPFVSHFFVAEECYAKELSFVGKRFTVLENKVIQSAVKTARGASAIAREGHHNTVRKDPTPTLSVEHRVESTTDNITPRRGSDRYAGSPDTDTITLLFTGTLAETTGVFGAIALARALHAVDSRIRLLIAGYAAQSGVQQQLRNVAGASGFIRLVGIERLVPHKEIMECLASADFAIISYPKNRSTWNARPTKLFEYLASRIPILLIDNPRWVGYCTSYSAAVVYSADAIDAPRIHAEMLSRTFYTAVPTDIYWVSEEAKLLETVSKYIH